MTMMKLLGNMSHNAGLPAGRFIHVPYYIYIYIYSSISVYASRPPPPSAHLGTEEICKTGVAG